MDVVSRNVHWLLPEEASPCDVFLYFRGQYASAIPSGQVVSFKLLEKLAKAQCSHIYIRAADEARWDQWVRGRCPSPGAGPSPVQTKEEEKAQKLLYGNKRAELLSYVQKSIVKKLEGDIPLDEAFAKALLLLQKIVKLPTLDWYFKQFHEPPDLFHHCGRVAYALAAFMVLRNVAPEDEIESICFSALIHELSGDLAENAKTVVSVQTLAVLEKNKHPVPREVIRWIELHDELVSGKGFPNNRKRADIPAPVRAFTLFNHFDSYRTRNSGTRRARLERTKETMAARIGDYDSSLWPLFWDFWERQVEAVT
ncbi:MAG: hypothetical protein ACXWR1_14830 [Bdellovibrionota bacterium]